MRIILDAMGGDYAPAEIVKGAVEAAKDPKITIILVGDQLRVNSELKKYPAMSNIQMVHASGDISMSEHPVEAVRQKKDASINVAMKLLKEGKGDALVGAGNTGAVMASALLNVGRIKGVERPAIASRFPSSKGTTVILDIGANADNRPSHLVQFAYMGRAYIEKIHGVKNPRIGLLNIGEEDEKGCELTIETNKLLRQQKGLNFIGNIEGKDITENEADVVVCDGFTGNIVLKFAEGLFFSLQKMVKQSFSKSIFAMFGFLFQIRALKDVKKKLDYTEYGGAPLLGVDGIVLITHGRSKSKTIANAVRAAVKEVEQGLLGALQNTFSAESNLG